MSKMVRKTTKKLTFSDALTEHIDVKDKVYIRDIFGSGR